jgi:hypothetical protein
MGTNMKEQMEGKKTTNRIKDEEMGRAMKILSQETKNNIIFETVFNVQIIS